MVKIRLRRTGAKKKPSYRVVVADSRTPRDGRFIEIIGHYIPTTEPSSVKIREDRVLHWLSVGAQPTDPVKKLLQNLGTLDRFAQLKDGADLEELLADAAAARSEPASPVQAEAEELVESENVEAATSTSSEEEVTAEEEPSEETESD